MAHRSHYEVLGVTVRATADEVRAAYRRAARDHHPDAGGDEGRMSELNAAWHVLGDPGRRAAYDRQLARRPAVAVSETDGAWEPPVEEVWADLADDRPLRPTRPLEGWWAMLPPATLLAAVGAMFGAFVFSAPSLLAVAGGLMVLALGLFVLAPLRAMSRRDDGEDTA
jgi:hypothetical protein